MGVFRFIVLLAFVCASLDVLAADEELDKLARKCARGGSGGVPDSVLIARLKSGDETASATLYERYQPIALRIANEIVAPKHRALAEDLAQEALVRLLVDPYQGEFHNFQGLLASVIRNKYIDHVRSPRNGDKISIGYDADREWHVDPPAAAIDPDKAIDRADLLQGVYKNIELLPENERRVVRLRFGSDPMPTLEEIAKMLDLPLGTVKTQLRQGLIKLRAMAEEVPQLAPVPKTPEVVVPTPTKPVAVLTPEPVRPTEKRHRFSEDAELLMSLLSPFERDLLAIGPQANGSGLNFEQLSSKYHRKVGDIQARHTAAKKKIDHLLLDHVAVKSRLEQALGFLTPEERLALQLEGQGKSHAEILAELKKKNHETTNLNGVARLLTDAKRLLNFNLESYDLAPRGETERNELPEFLEEQIKTEAGSDRLLRAINRLPENQMRVVRMKLAGRLTSAQIAARLRLVFEEKEATTNSAHLVFLRAVENLQDMYKKNEVDLPPPASTKFNLAAAAADPASRAVLMERIGKLPPALEAVLRLKVEEGLSHQDTADRLNQTRTKPLDAATVSHFYNQGLGRLEEMYKEAETGTATLKGADAFDLADHASTQPKRERLGKGLARLSEKSRRVVELKLEGLSFAEILAKINEGAAKPVTRAAVAERYYAALEALGEMYRTGDIDKPIVLKKTGFDFDVEFEEPTRRAILMSRVAKLPPGPRRALTLRAEGLTFDEVAEKLSEEQGKLVSRKNVIDANRRGTEALRKIYEPQE